MARKLVSRVSWNAPFLPTNRPTHCPLGTNFHPPLFLLWWVWFNPKPTWQQNNWWNSDQNPHFYTHTTFLAKKWYKSSPPLSPLTLNHYSSCKGVTFMYRDLGWPQMCNSGKGHQFPLFEWGLAGLTLGANVQPPILLWWVWFDPRPIWEQKIWWNSDQNPHFYSHTTFLAGKWHISSPPLSPLTANSLIFMQRCYIYV